ncbi:MAG: hypothetical protein AAGF11_27410 [Myxococcota bacterium]
MFPGHHFYSVPTKAEVASNPESFPYPGFTGNTLTDASERTPPEAALELVSRAAQEALGDRRRRAADLVVVVDDVELQNAEQPARIVSVMRRAVEEHLGQIHQTRHLDKTRDLLCAKVSFHLIAPMIESWFFADSRALERAGVQGAEHAVLNDKTDPEAFKTTDPGYLAATELDCPALAALPAHRKKKLRPKWLGTLPRGRYPKGYLQWLCRVPADRTCTSYSETSDGGAALAQIRWESLFSRPPDHFGLLRALVDDLEDGLGCAPAMGRVDGEVSPLTARSLAPQDAVLRNI